MLTKQNFVLLIVLVFAGKALTQVVTLSTLDFPDPHVGAALTTDGYGLVTDSRVGTKVGDVYEEVKWVDYLTKFVVVNGGTPVPISAGSAGLAPWDNDPAAPVADGYFIPARFESWTYDAVNAPAVWHNVLEYENGGDHIIGGVGYKLLDPSPTLDFPYAELNPAYRFTNVGGSPATLKTIHYERNAQSGNTVYSNHGGGQWDYDNADGTSDDYVVVSSAVSGLPYISYAGFPLAHYRIQDSAGDLLDELQNAGANYDLGNGINAVLNTTVEIGYQVADITLAPGEAVLYWLYPKPIKVVNTAQEYPTDIDYEKKTVNSTGVDYAFANTDVSINYSGLEYMTNGAGVTATAMAVTVAEIADGIVTSGVSGAIDRVSSVRYWEIFYDTRRQSTVGDLTFTYDPASDGITDESTLTLAYRTDYDQNWTEWIGVVQDQDNNTLTAISVNLDDSQWILATTSGDNPLPVELTSFSASLVEGAVLLSWSTATENNNYGFNIERSVDGITWSEIGFAAGKGTTTTPANYTFVDQNLSAGEYAYRLKQVDLDGTFEYSDELTVVITLPVQFELLQNYPNPFNPETRVKYTLSESSRTILKAYNLLGQEVRTLVDRFQPAGTYEVLWNGRDDRGNTVPSGVYLYRLKVGDGMVQTRKMILMQ